MPDWFALLPEEIANQQMRWERNQAIKRAHDAGATFTEIARAMGKSPSYPAHLAAQARRFRKSPFDRYMEQQRLSLEGKMKIRAWAAHMLPPPATHNQAQIDIGRVRLKVQIADTPAMRERGLSDRTSLAPFDGMLFVFSEPGTLWMKDMLFPLDIIWISPDGKVADVTENAEPESYPERFASRSPAQFAVEVPAGFVRQHHISIGDRVSI